MDPFLIHQTNWFSLWNIKNKKRSHHNCQRHDDFHFLSWALNQIETLDWLICLMDSQVKCSNVYDCLLMGSWNICDGSGPCCFIDFHQLFKGFAVGFSGVVWVWTGRTVGHLVGSRVCGEPVRPRHVVEDGKNILRRRCDLTRPVCLVSLLWCFCAESCCRLLTAGSKQPHRAESCCWLALCLPAVCSDSFSDSEHRLQFKQRSIKSASPFSVTETLKLERKSAFHW